jgi:hypothetical protein
MQLMSKLSRFQMLDRFCLLPVSLCVAVVEYVRICNKCTSELI